jgi:hypothetical protein
MQLAGSKFSLNEYVTAGFPPPTTTFKLEWWQLPLPLLHLHTQWLASHNAAATTPLLAVGPTPHHLKTNTIIKLVW